MTQRLTRGQRLKLSDLGLNDRFELTLSVVGPSVELYLMAAWLSESDKAVGWDYTVLAQGNRVASNGSLEVRSSGHGHSKIAVNLGGKPAGAVKLAVALTFEDRNPQYAENARAIESGSLELGAGVARFNFSQADFGLERTLLLGEFYQKDGVWRFRIMGEGYFDGVNRLLEHWQLPPNLIAPPQWNLESGAQAARDGNSGSRIVFPTQPKTPLTLPSSWPAHLAGGGAPRIPSGIAKSVGFILVKYNGGQTATGTGFVVSPAGYLLTCAHVLEDGESIVCRLEGTEEFRPLEVIAYSDEHDLAVTYLSDGKGALDYLVLERETPELGDDLGLLGYPLTNTLGEGITYTQGIVNGVREKDGIPYLQIDTGAAPGMSGGPIFRRGNGKVIGLISVVFHTGGGMLLNLGVDIRNLWRLGWARE